MTQWYEDYCPKCQKSNWIDNGDPQDMTVEDVEGIRCWNCGHCWLLGEECDLDEEECDEAEQDKDGHYYEDGKDFKEVKHKKCTKKQK